jgi:hypothetical protein
MLRVRTACILFALALPVRPAGALFDKPGLDPAFCQQPTVRRTVVYIDDMMMISGQTEWAQKLDTKLRATLTPGESVTVVRLSPASGRSKEGWSGCWPAFSDEQKAKIEREYYFLLASPLTRIAEQQKYFIHDFGASLTQIYVETKREPDEASFTAGRAPRKQILRALASDEGRFANTQTTIRGIIYSDMAENSDLGSVFQPTPPVSYGQRLGSYLRRGVFYAFGVGEDVADNPTFAENARQFWSVALKSMSATVMGMGSDLNVPNTLPVSAYGSSVVLNFDGQDLDGRLSLLIGEDGSLVDSWIGISRLGTAALTGSFRCQSSGNCRLESMTTSGITTNAPTETLILSGTAKVMAGQLGVKDQNLTYQLKTRQSGN